MKKLSLSKVETKRKVRADFDKSQPITVNVKGCSEDVKKQVIQAFFDVGLFWSTGERSLTPSSEHVSSYANFPNKVPGDTKARKYILWSIYPIGITPSEFFAMVYEDEPQGHPHADLMMQYAEDAKAHAEPWRLWQLKNKKQPEWFDCSFNPNWDIDLQYRRKVKTHLVHGVEVPDLRIKPKRGDLYHVVGIDAIDYFNSFTYSGDDLDILLVDRGLCYEHTEAGKHAAILHAKAMLGIA